MATRTKSSIKTTPAKKKETKKQKTLPSAARGEKVTKGNKGGKATKAPQKVASLPSRESPKKQKKQPAKADLKKSVAKTIKTPAKAASKTTSAKKKAKPFVKSTNSKKTAKTTETKTTRAAKTPATKPAKGASPKSGADETVAKANRTGKAVAARKAEGARPAKSKKKGAENAPAASGKQKASAPVASETAAKVAKTLIRRKAAKKGEVGKNKPARPIAFTLDEALEIAKTKPDTSEQRNQENGNGNQVKGRENSKKEVPDDLKQENRTLGAASISDILGYNPNAGPKKEDDQDVPPKFARYYKLLLELREHVVSGLDIHTKETLKRSSKEDTGNLSAYSQHMADAGTDTFDRDFALSLVSSEQDALYEIEDAIRRIKRGSYGVCEITGKPIKKERLLAVPFAKFSVEGQVEYERTHRKSAYRGGAFGDSTEEGVKFMDEDSDE